ncbi:PLP-dependent aminotransferase family protein [Arvimicrobium flavum]|uniref:aminotransferase-like domain-containing protein n=1 Tax=Arvimicrobium flavum TaxID=3393320 RepID=UPI00237B3E38|nr:PLP-dependent aminotransferase family protein [Mesorhizobium shangrilense]
MTPEPTAAAQQTVRFRSGLPDPLPVWNGLPRFNFIGGHNDPDAIPVEALAEASAAALRANGQSMALYNLGHGAFGFEGLRDEIARKLAETRSIEVSRAGILVTSGSGQGLDLVNGVLVEPGDTVVIEAFTYSGALGKARKLGAEVAGAPLDAGGLDVARLGDMLEAMAGRGVRPKYIYTIPTIQNPTGTILDLERRHRLVEIARHHRVPIFEDECYAELTFAEQAPPALCALAPESVIHIGSFSKTLAPALRIGYVVADPAILRQIAALKSDGGTGALDQMVVAEYLRGGYREHVRSLVDGLSSKLDVMLDAIHSEFGASVDVVRPAGGIFVWLRFPDGFDVRTLVAPAAKRGVVFNPGPEWACNPEDARNLMRLCFALPSADDIREGVAQLAEVCFETAGFPQHRANVARSR